MAIVISTISEKGGVGKTTTATNLAAALGQAGQRTLLVDLDPSHNATQALGMAAEHGDIADVLFRGAPLAETILHTNALGVDLVPSSRTLLGADVRLASEPRREDKLKKALSRIRDRYDYIILDAPPALGLLPLNSLVAADYYVVPVTPDKFSVGGLAALLEYVQRMEDAFGAGEIAQLAGIAIVNADYRSNLTRGMEEYLRANLPGHTFDAVVRVNVAVREAQMAGRSIFDHAPASPAARAYVDLANELRNRVMTHHA